MANARKCDLCKKCFDPLDQPEGVEMMRFRNPVFQTSESIRTGTVNKFLIPDEPDIWVDLCPDCTESFKLFMNGGMKREKIFIDPSGDVDGDGLQLSLRRFIGIGRDS